MFCGNCGKEMISNTRFCQFCGAEQNAVVIPAASIPVSAPVEIPNDTASVSDTSNVTVSSTPIEPSVTSIPTEPILTSMGVPVNESEPIYEESASAAPTESSDPVANTIPTPNTIPTSNMDLPETAVYSSSVITAAPTQTAPAKTTSSTLPQTEITIKDAEKRPPERKYTLGHIMMCLAAAAVMAVTAGVFAGLYFSVI